MMLKVFTTLVITSLKGADISILIPYGVNVEWVKRVDEKCSLFWF